MPKGKDLGRMAGVGRLETTNPDTVALTPQQEAAADLLAVGRTVTEVAAQVGVARQTVSEWLKRWRS